MRRNGVSDGNHVERLDGDLCFDNAVKCFFRIPEYGIDLDRKQNGWMMLYLSFAKVTDFLKE